MTNAARELITRLDLAPLAGEGGYFRATWRSESGSAIVYLLTTDDFSALHRIAQDEMWHFYDGDAVEHLQIDSRSGVTRRTVLGPDVFAGEQRQVSIPARTWQGARIRPATQPRGFALLGCTVTPPWEASGFELARSAEFQHVRSEHTQLIDALMR